MRLTSSRAYSRPPPVPKMPAGLVELMEDLTRSVLRHNPPDVYQYCTNHMAKLLEIRDGRSPLKRLTLEQKIAKAQEIVRKRADERRKKYDEDMRLFLESQKLDTTIKGEKKVEESAISDNNLKTPIHHEEDLKEALEVEIFHEPLHSDKVSEQAQKVHLSEQNSVIGAEVASKEFDSATKSDVENKNEGIINSATSIISVADNVTKCLEDSENTRKPRSVERHASVNIGDQTFIENKPELIVEIDNGSENNTDSSHNSTQIQSDDKMSSDNLPIKVEDNNEEIREVDDKTLKQNNMITVESDTVIQDEDKIKNDSNVKNSNTFVGDNDNENVLNNVNVTTENIDQFVVSLRENSETDFAEDTNKDVSRSVTTDGFKDTLNNEGLSSSLAESENNNESDKHEVDVVENEVLTTIEVREIPNLETVNSTEDISHEEVMNKINKFTEINNAAEAKDDNVIEEKDDIKDMVNSELVQQANDSTFQSIKQNLQQLNGTINENVNESSHSVAELIHETFKPNDIGNNEKIVNVHNKAKQQKALEENTKTGEEIIHNVEEESVEEVMHIVNQADKEVYSVVEKRNVDDDHVAKDLIANMEANEQKLEVVKENIQSVKLNVSEVSEPATLRIQNTKTDEENLHNIEEKSVEDVMHIANEADKEVYNVIENRNVDDDHVAKHLILNTEANEQKIEIVKENIESVKFNVLEVSEPATLRISENFTKLDEPKHQDKIVPTISLENGRKDIELSHTDGTDNNLKEKIDTHLNDNNCISDVTENEQKPLIENKTDKDSNEKIYMETIEISDKTVNESIIPSIVEEEPNVNNIIELTIVENRTNDNDAGNNSINDEIGTLDDKNHLIKTLTDNAEDFHVSEKHKSHEDNSDTLENVSVISEPVLYELETASIGKSSSIDDNTIEDGSDSILDHDESKNSRSESNSLQSIHNPSMDLETAAITIQKVFRTFMFKSRGSTFEDSGNDESNLSDYDAEKVEVAFPVVASSLNKDRRTLGISRMDTVLQTVNEEKSLSLSTDDSSTLSSAATTIQAHVRGYLVRSRLNSNKTASSTSLVNSDGQSTHSLEAETDKQNVNKTILNIHIVPEGGHYLSRDESILTSMELSLDSPPSSVNLHPLGYDKSEPRKQLKREDAIQSISPPSNNSGKLSEDSVKEITVNDAPEVVDTAGSRPGSRVKNTDKETSINPTIETFIEDLQKADSVELNKENLITECRKRSLTKMSSDESDVVTPFAPVDKRVSPDSEEPSRLEHSGEFHDVVMPTKVSRTDPSVVREFKNVLVKILLWHNS